MTTPAQKKIDLLLKQRGARSVAALAGVGEKALRALRDGATPRAATKARLAKLGVGAADWLEASGAPVVVVDDLDALEAGRMPADVDDLRARLEARYQDAALSASERLRAASIVLALAKRLPGGSRSGADRLDELARDLVDADPSVWLICDRHHRAADDCPENPAHAVLAWARSVARDRDAPERVVTMACALEARAKKLCDELATRPGADALAELAADILKRPIVGAALADVLERHGLESRPLAPPQYNTTAHDYGRRCAENGWRPRDRNAPWVLGSDGYYRVQPD